MCLSFETCTGEGVPYTHLSQSHELAARNLLPRQFDACRYR
jgi:hypothetical protein